MLLFLLWMGLGHAKPTISPAKTGPVAAGGTVQFKANMPVRWSLEAGSAGSIDQNGNYKAPDHLAVHNELGGCPALPNNHVLNTRVDALPLSAKSDEWIRMLPEVRFNYYPAWGLNIADANTPRENMHFLYSEKNDGRYEIPKWPELQRENGVFSGPHSDVDRHVVTVDRESCRYFELYNNYRAGENKECAACTAQGGVAYDGNSFKLPEGSSDAAGLFLAPLSIHLSEIRMGQIQHAARFTLTNNLIAPSSVWPSRAHAGAWGKIPYGTRFRLRADFDIAGFSPAAKILLNQLKQYGVIVADGGASGEIQTFTDVTLDPQVEAAMLEIRAKGPMLRDLQVVDESGLMISEDSGEINARSSYAQDEDTATIVATDANHPESKSEYRLHLQPVTVGMASPSLWIQSGVTAHLTAWVNGTNNQGVSWSVVAGGSAAKVSADGTFAAPTVDKPTTIGLKAASISSPDASAMVAVTILPPGPIRVDVGNATRAPGAPNRSYPDYGPDSEGHMWWRDQAGEVSWGVVNDDWQGPWPKQKDIALYYTSRYSEGDMVYRFLVPNGNYKIKILVAQGQCKDKFPKDWRAPIHVEAQGKIVLRDFDLGSAIHYSCQTPVTITIPATVKDNSLYFALRRITAPKLSPTPLLSAYSISPDNEPAHLAIDPAKPEDVVAGDQTQLYAVGWYMGNDVNWSLQGPGTIGADGLYHAPNQPPAKDTEVQIEAQSKADTTKTATVRFVLKTGQMKIAPAEATVVRGMSQAFDVKFGDAAYKNLDWSLTPSLGSVNADGVYSAPASLAQDTQVKATAQSKELPNFSATATINLKVAPPTIRIHCGEGGPFQDAQGHVWSEDSGFSPGVVRYRANTPIAGAAPDMQQLYQSATYRYAGEPFRYSFDLPNGRYAVTLKFADYTYNEPGHYSFDVSINGKKVLSRYDPDREKGPKTAVDKTFETTVKDKKLKIDFVGLEGAAFINGIEISYVGS